MANEFWSETNVSQMRSGTISHFGQTPSEPSASFVRSAASAIRPGAVVGGGEVARRVVRVVVVVEEVPAGDVVDVAVAVVVDAVGEPLDHVLAGRRVLAQRGLEVVDGARGLAARAVGSSPSLSATFARTPPLSQRMPVSSTATSTSRPAAA
jgi:hypothetical protein